MPIKRLPVIRHIIVRPRLIIAALIGVILQYTLPPSWRETTRILVSWDSASALYLMMVAWMMVSATPQKMRHRALVQDEGQIITLMLTISAALASLAAIVAELAKAKTVGHLELQHVALAGITVFLSWAFMQTMFALHYAHEYYSEENGRTMGGLEFPGHVNQDNFKPDYWDFIYYSFIIGTACATADINITSGTLRKITTVHCVVAFFFNTTILALTVNIGAGLF